MDDVTDHMTGAHGRQVKDVLRSETESSKLKIASPGNSSLSDNTLFLRVSDWKRMLHGASDDTVVPVMVALG